MDELIRRGIADDERPQGGAVIVKIDEKLGLKKEKYRSNVILRSDGTTLYLTKDLALAKQKFEQYHVDRSIYVVDIRQSMHLQQAFAILQLWGFPQAEKCYHLGYGFVTLPEGAMSARRGQVVLFKDVLDEAIRRVLALESDRTPDMSESSGCSVAGQIGLGALAYSMLSVDNGRDIVFDMDSALSFEGHTGPYIQNAHVRANSILKKAGELPAQAVFDYALGAHEVAAGRADLALSGTGRASRRRVPAADHGRLRLRSGECLSLVLSLPPRCCRPNRPAFAARGCASWPPSGRRWPTP